MLTLRSFMHPSRHILALSASVLALLSPILRGDEPSRAFTLVEEGEPRCVVVVSDNPSVADLDAVKELRYWVKAITRADLRVVPAAEWDGKTPFIAVGESSVTRKQGWEVDNLGFEEAKVIVEPERIGLLGSRALPEGKVPWPESAPRAVPSMKRSEQGTTGPGSYYAVLEFVQRKLGARWIWPGKLGEVHPKTETLRVEVEQWSWEPSGYLGRGMRGGYSDRGEQYEKLFGVKLDAERMTVLHEELDQWRYRQRMNRPEKTRTGLTFLSWWDKYSRKHPEWFAKAPEGRKSIKRDLAKLNLSNPEVVEQVVEDWKRDQQTNPDLRFYLNITPNDGKGFDTRKETRALDAPEMQTLTDEEIWLSDKAVLSDRHLHFWNAIAAKVAEVNPNTKLMTFAYCRYRKPPLMKGRVSDNIIIGFVGGEGFYPDEPETLEEYLGWQAIGGKLYWRSNLLHCGHGIPYLYSRQLHGDLSAMIANDLLGTDYDSLTGNWANQGLNIYIAAELQNRPKASYATLSKEYFSAFGPAAEPMERYHQFFEKLVKEKAPLLRDKRMVENESWGKFWRGHVRFVAVVLTDEVMEQAGKLMNEAEDAVRNGTSEEQARVAFVRKGFTHAQTMAEAFRGIGLHRLGEPLELDYEKLKPLWKLRQAQMLQPEYNSLLLLVHEQVQFNIWGDFIHNAKFLQENVHRTPLMDTWEAAVVPRGSEEWRANPASAAWNRVAAPGNPVQALPSQDVVYRTTFDMPQLRDHEQYAALELSGAPAGFRLWINGRRVPTGAFKTLKGTSKDSPTVVLNILDFVEQAKPVTLEFRAAATGSAVLAQNVYLLTQ